jgi:prepilin-type N-terminal cleavage/methylation domain-containing protein
MVASKNSSTQKKQHGFSLIELLVVLVLMGLVASLAFPRIQSALLAYERQSMEDMLFVFLRQQMARASLTGISFDIPEGTSFQLELNEATNQIEITLVNHNALTGALLYYKIDEALHINSNGICMGSKVSMTFNEARRQLVLKKPFCNEDHSNAE